MEFDDDQLDYSDLDDRRPGQSAGSSGGINADPYGVSGQRSPSTGNSGGGLLANLGMAAVLGMLRSGGQKNAQQTQQPAQRRTQMGQQRGVPFPGAGAGGGGYGQTTIEPLPPEPPQKKGPSLLVRILLIGAAVLVAMWAFNSLMSACSRNSTPAAAPAPTANSNLMPGGSNAVVPANQGDMNAMRNRCVNSEAIMKYDDCYILKSFNEINEVWTSYFGKAGQQYRKPKLVYFTSSVKTACGPAKSNAGPFYCPGDQTVYIDLAYMNKLFADIGAQGRYAQTYVIAHEIGHHVQNLLGTEAQVRKLQQKSPGQVNQLSVKLELQADCYAGVYGRIANDAGNQKITQPEYEQALVAAAAVGDDAIMSNAGMRVNQEKFTHGSSANRQKWFINGFTAANISACNTFG